MTPHNTLSTTNPTQSIHTQSQQTIQQNISSSISNDELSDTVLNDMVYIMNYVTSTASSLSATVVNTARNEYAELKNIIEHTHNQSTPTTFTLDTSDMCSGVDNVLNKIEHSIDSVENKLSNVGQSIWSNTTSWLTATLHTIDNVIDELASSNQHSNTYKNTLIQQLSIEPTHNDYALHKKSFDTSIQYTCDSVDLQNIYNELVPSAISHSEFWCRYTYNNPQYNHTTFSTNTYNNDNNASMNHTNIPLKHAESASSMQSWVSVDSIDSIDHLTNDVSCMLDSSHWVDVNK